MTNTYTALISLLILGDDLARVDRDAIVESMRCMQQPDGRYVKRSGKRASMG